ncbi:1ccab4a0-e852-45a6-85f6-20e115bc98b0 [Sclerotinia trifoliorum]|uniref:1ccab4a0-e852-45a6-85f6-20e115bc98b0 n=1 Tax=Sclerotinia trifoliorum TaxID=28548 RepID=A0A8H2VSN9_9HELO|nr:1ccab4a0-e852-45a6-85f6-20e115bc98b0 [Sclerotinia trifoliorum]
MKGVIIKSLNASWEVVDNLENPVPGKHQILVKSLVTGINPLDNLMRTTGLLIPSYPIVLGCDASGVVVETGSEVSKFRVGDGVFGCSPPGAPGYGTFQEFHLMDEKLAFKRPENVSVEEAATIGVGLLTAAISLDAGNDIMYPASRENQPEWFIVLGGASNVGQYGIKLAKLSGYQVLASCSESSVEIAKSAGADATFDYKQPIESQLSEIESITSGDFAGIFDASAASSAVALAALNTKSRAKTQKKTFSTTNNWDPIEEQKDISIYQVNLGQIGKSGEPAGDAVNRAVEKLIPRLESLLWKGLLEPNEGEIVATGFAGVSFGVDLLTKNGIRGKKVMVKLQDL